MSETNTHKVLILFCGGTLVMQEQPDGSLAIPDAETAVAMVRDLEPRLSETTHLDLELIAAIDSTNMTQEIWRKITRVIAERYEDYDGFVITHGTDTMAYTASALAYSLGNLGKPVVLTGAQIPSTHIRTDARRNFINAVWMATATAAGVFVVFDEAIIHGTRVSKVSESRLNAFESVNAPLAGEIRVTMRLDKNLARRHSEQLKVIDTFSDRVLNLAIFPGMGPHILEKMLNCGAEGYIIQGFGTGNIPSRIISFFEKAQEKKIPVVVSTQCREGATMMATYEVGKKALELGAIEAYDLSIEAMTTKLMWCLGQKLPYEKISELMHTPIAGDIRSYTKTNS